MLIERLTPTLRRARIEYANEAHKGFIPYSYTRDAASQALSDRVFDYTTHFDRDYLYLDYMSVLAHVLCRRDRLNNVYRQF